VPVGASCLVLISFSDKRLEVYEAGFFTYAIESYDSPSLWRIPFVSLFSMLQELRIATSLSVQVTDHALQNDA
jgi:hypothetical protein